MVGVVAAVRGQVEGHRQTLLASGEVAAVECVGLFGGGEAGVLADGPRTHHVHRRVGTAQERGDARRVVQVLHAFEVFGLSLIHIDVTFSSFYVDGPGFEPRLVGAITSSDKGAVSAPVKGMSGVYVFEVEDVQTADKQTAEGEKVRAQAMNESMAQQFAIPAVQQMAEKMCIRDRGKIEPTVLLDKKIENQISFLTQDRGHKFIKLVVSPYVAAFLRKGLISLRRRWEWKYKVRIEIAEDQSTGIVEVHYHDKNDNDLINK